MKVQKETRLFFDPNVDSSLGEFVINKEESHHIAKVLRCKLGEQIWITNGRGLLMSGEIIQIKKNHTTVNLQSVIEQREQESELCIAIAPTKSMDRFEWFLEKATEIGVSKIIPILTDNSERKILKPDRLNKKIVSAMKQSGRLWKPELSDMMRFNDVVETINRDNKFIAHCHESHAEMVDEYPANAIILVGPEGGFSTTEVSKALNKGYEELSLGDYRLRSETAGIAVAMLFGK